MKIDRIQNYNQIYNYPKQNTKNNEDGTKKEATTGYAYNPAYYMPFKGGYSLNLTETVRKLDILALKNLQIYPPNIREWLGMFLETAGNGKKTLIAAHKEYFSALQNCSSLLKIKEKFPEFKDVASVYDVETSANRGSFITKFLNGETEYFDSDEDLTVQLIKLYWGEGFSLNDLKKYSDGCDLYYTMKKLNIPLASRDYGHILKFSDPEYNERLTREMTEKRLAALDRKAQELEGEPVYIKRGPLSDEHKKRISEGLIRYYEEHPEKIYEMSERQKGFLKENPKDSEIFARVVKKTWNMSGSENIKKALSNFFKKNGVSVDTEINPAHLTKEQSRLMQKFWTENEWAQKLFSKNMKYAWKKVKQENETFYTIKTCPDVLREYVEDKAGLARGSLDLTTKYNPFTKESYINDEFNAIFIQNATIENLADIMADTYQLAVINIARELENIPKTKNNKPFNELHDIASAMISLNVITAKGGYNVQSTREAQLDFITLATQAVESKCEELVEIVNEALNNAFDLAIKYHRDFLLSQI